jgi:hypothetical protein
MINRRNLVTRKGLQFLQSLFYGFVKSRMWRRQTSSFLSLLYLSLYDYFIPKMTAYVSWGSEVYLPPIK